MQRATSLTVTGALLLLFVLSVANRAQAQTDLSSGTAQITKLLSEVSDHSKKPSEILDPTMDEKERSVNLEYLDDPSYELSVIATAPIQFKEGRTATLPVRVHFKNEVRELEASSVAEFVNRNDKWYFANFNFLGFPRFLIALTVLAVAVSILYAAGILFLRTRLLRQGDYKLANRVKIIIPIFWPRLYRTTKPPSSAAVGAP